MIQKMVTGIDIRFLRGIKNGHLAGLLPLSVLTGPNGCGKSTVLDGLHLASSPEPAEALGETIGRRSTVRNGARWLSYGNSVMAMVSLNPNGSESPRIWRFLRLARRVSKAHEERLRISGVLGPYSTIEVFDLEQGQKVKDESAPDALVSFGADNRFEAEPISGEGAPKKVRLVDPGIPKSLTKGFSEAVRRGARAEVQDLLAELLPAGKALEILTEDDESSGLYLTDDEGAVPIGLEGDGIQAFLQLTLELAMPSGGLVLIEEPEVYQHPKAIRQTAKAIWASVRRGVQIVLSTHSLELIDALLAEAGDDLEKMAVFNLLLEAGTLKYGRRAGEEIQFSRMELENDLR